MDVQWKTWTMTPTDRGLEAFEVWIWRRMEKISWLDKVTNEEVLSRVPVNETDKY